ncbi:MAG: oligoendopeptidase F [Fusicatenibacter sp.]|nr:oligoendopeptidase F [Lachnospiraceae bacterium]MDY2937968.1 oligoendopeptidase F [Fusicatenibacter sp.]
MGNKSLKKREEMDPSYCWDLSALFVSDEEFENAFQKLESEIERFRGFAGEMKKGPEQMYRVLTARDDIHREFERIYVYASQKYHQDMGNEKYQGYAGRAESLAAVMADAFSFVEPEILELDKDTIASFLGAYEPLHLYKRMLNEQLRQKEHILTPQMEAVLAKASEMGGSPSQIYMAFHNADLTFDTVTDENGGEKPLTHGNFISFEESKERRVRKEAFEKYYDAYDHHKNMLAAAFTANLKQAAFFAEMRRYPSVLEAELDGGNIPVSVYEKLIEAVHRKLPSMYRYVALRKKILGVDELHMYDVYVPLASEAAKEIPYEEAKEIVKAGLSVLGEDYVALLEKGFTENWVDVYENQGKRSGAYSWGAYGSHPFVLMNYAGNLDSVFTLAHEMGHSLHSYYSDAKQPYPYAGYRIFVAEVASTCNEALLIHYLLEHAKDKKEKAYLINHFLDQFKGTLFRQTMFAEFEKLTHEKLSEEGTLTAGGLNDLYLKLNQLYYGPEMISDPQIALEWARIPHFYTPFYVYQYATGFSAAVAISRKILAGEPGIVEKYKEFLSGGSSMDPIDLLRICGVDMTSPEPVEEALDVFGEYVKQLEDIQNA